MLAEIQTKFNEIVVVMDNYTVTNPDLEDDSLRFIFYKRGNKKK